MKKSILSLLCVFTINILIAQEVKKDVETLKTKIDLFSSKTGLVTKIIDYKLPILKTSFAGAETRVRKINIGVNSAFFYQIVKEGKYGNSTASIEFSDLIEVLKALKALKSEVEKDISVNPDYLENKFSTVDGFQVGYYINSGKSTWYLKLEKYGSDNTLFISDGDIIDTAFTEAKNKIEELKKQ